MDPDSPLDSARLAAAPVQSGRGLHDDACRNRDPAAEARGGAAAGPTPIEQALEQAAAALAAEDFAAAAGVYALLSSALQVKECAIPACEAVAALSTDASTARALRAAGVLPPLVALLSPPTNPAAVAAVNAQARLISRSLARCSCKARPPGGRHHAG